MLLVVVVSFVLVVVGLLALTGGLRLRSPIGEMESHVDRLPMLADERVVERHKVEDAVCFLQCSDWSVDIVVERSTSEPTIEAECAALAVRLKSWARSDVEVRMTADASFDCLLVVESPAFGHDDWEVLASVEWPDDPSKDSNMAWSVTLLKS